VSRGTEHHLDVAAEGAPDIVRFDGFEETGRPATRRGATLDPVGVRVLVVDDEPSIRELFALLLDDDPRCAEVRLAADPREAVAAIEDGCPDAMVLDFMLGSVTSVALLEQLRAACPQSRITVFTADLRLAVEARVLERGADSLLEKSTVPFDAVIDALLSQAGGPGSRPN
jgi:CheY-like chemotaxis protein